MSAFEDHDWECRSDHTAADPWLWEVYRDGALAGYLKSEKSGFLANDNFYDAYDANNVELTGGPIDLEPFQSHYNNALMLIHMAAEGHRFRPAEGRWT